MKQPLKTGRSTPRYFLFWVSGVIIGSIIRLGLWVVPKSLANRAMDAVLP